MEIEWSWLLLGLPIAFVLGWLASRMDWRQMRVAQRHSPRNYFQGLTYLLNEQQDKAIDVFVQAVQSDPDTIDLHFALGSLFRRRGEYLRAVRVHEHLLARADVQAADRARAQWELAQDFLKAGIYDRAEQALLPLENSDRRQQAQLALLHVYERMHDWPKALELADRITAEEAASGEPRAVRTAGRQMHYWCEQADEALQRGDFARAAQLLEQAQRSDAQSLRPAIEQVRLALRQGQERQALEQVLALLETRSQAAPDVLPLLAGLLGGHFERLKPERDLLERMHALLRAHYEQYAQNPQYGSLDVLLALVALEHCLEMPRADLWYAEHLRRRPSLVAAARWVQSQCDDAPLRASLDVAQRPWLRYRCMQCGFEASRYFWQCPGCQSWESFPPQRVEELAGALPGAQRPDRG
ncbi:lipopolysaccharide assembly protein LapB [Allofranklinella schreckenbergeri]|uniref:Lipopolysaccharide assembly protein LapB n=1 Tax=Allofranklinella schreckenbergeri TaxID=1076744 RepID=A0A3M6PZ56_9BURK|nr:lipopolysaccharide assembly protein LapB [Allofranklinella schreckenbergeri]RMW95520.1 lipopolysaccharide assembly protein LapB [Allofranklinella schreckenbergeri]